MPPLGSRRVIVPSSSLLRFLRAQAKDSAFFTANKPAPRSKVRVQLSRATGCTSASSRAARPFSTCGPHKATVEASLLNFDFLTGVLSQRSSTASAKTRPGIVVRHTSQDCSGRRRSASRDTHPWFQRLAAIGRSYGSEKFNELDNLKPDDLPLLPPFGDSTGAIFGRTKAASEPRLKCTEFDENGNVILVNGEFKKSELIAKYGLLPRDLRKIDSSLLPSIIIRPSSILINLLHLRVLLQYNRVLIFDAWGSSNTYAQSVFMYDLEGKLCTKDSQALPYEFRALEAVLISVTSGLESEYEGIREPVVRVLRELEEDIDRDKLRHLLVYSKKLGTFEQKARLVRDAIDALLEEDEDLSAMYLTEGAKGQTRDDEDHNEVEMLLESYHKVCDEIVQNSGNLVTNIRNTEEIVKAILDANRNALMLLDLKFSIGTLGIASGAFIAGLYGMNLENFIEETNFGFASVSGVSGILAIGVCMYGMHKLRKVQRVRMWSEQGYGSRGNWRELDATAGLPGEKRADRMKRLKEHREAISQKAATDDLRKRK